MTASFAQILMLGAACVDKTPDSMVALDSDTKTIPDTATTKPDDTATPSWACGEDVPSTVREIGVYQDLIYYRPWGTTVADNQEDWDALFDSLSDELPLDVTLFDPPVWELERAIVGWVSERWAWIPFGLYTATGDPAAKVPGQATWCVVHPNPQLDHSSTTIAAYAIPREWGDEVDSTLVIWDE